MEKNIKTQRTLILAHLIFDNNTVAELEQLELQQGTVKPDTSAYIAFLLTAYNEYKNDDCTLASIEIPFSSEEFVKALVLRGMRVSTKWLETYTLE